jgi:hypothetical protein
VYPKHQNKKIKKSRRHISRKKETQPNLFFLPGTHKTEKAFKKERKRGRKKMFLSILFRSIYKV